MDNQGSVKKIQRVQRAGVTRSSGQRRALGFPLAVAAVVIAGVVLTWFARDAYRGVKATAPRVNTENGGGDYFRLAYGTYICGQFVSQFTDVGTTVSGIHTKGDGLIHVRPISADSAGVNATFEKFADSVGLTVNDDSFTLPDAVSETTKTYKNGDACEVDGKKGKGEVMMFTWPRQAGDNTKATKRTSDFAEQSVREDGGSVVLAFMPAKTDACSNLSDSDRDDKGDPTVACVPLPNSISGLDTPASESDTTTASTELPATTAGGADASVPATTGSGAATTVAAPVTTASAAATTAAAAATTIAGG